MAAMNRATSTVIATRPMSPWGPGARDLHVVRAEGAEVTLSNGSTYLDLMNGKGSVILGHNHAEVRAAIARHVESNRPCSTGWGEHSTLLADELAADSGVDDARVLLFSTGTEACRAAVSLARRSAGRPLVLSCGYHGWDPMWSASSQLLEPNADGVIDCYFIPGLCEEALRRYRDRIAVMMISPDYVHLSAATLRTLVDLTRGAGILICCDDVKQGYRHCPGSYLPTYAGRAADLYTFSKGLSNGYRVSAVVAPAGLAKHGQDFTHTACFDELGIVAARTTLTVMKRADQYSELARRASATLQRVRGALEVARVGVSLRHHGATFQFVCVNDAVEAAFHAACFDAGLLVYEGDNQMLSTAYDEDVLAELEARLAKAAAALPPSHERISPQRIMHTAWSMIDGAADELPQPVAVEFVQAMIEQRSAG